MKSEHKKLILVAGLLAVAGGTYWFFNRSAAPLPNSVKFVCVATGEVFSISQKNLPSILPARNPKTGEMTLLPVTQRADGKLVVPDRAAYDLHQDSDLARVNKYVDTKTLEVLGSAR
jgi:hypothetical protein